MADRRSILIAMGAAPLAAVWPLRAAADRSAMRLGLTKVFLDDQVAFLVAWRRYLESRLSRRIEFVQRQAYREIVDPLRDGQLDLAWICGYPFVRHRDRLRLLAVPVFDGAPLYRSYLIVSANDTSIRSLDDLRGNVFAFSDPDSNSGYLYTLYRLRERGATPSAFFSRTFFTWAHRKVVEAVAAGVARGGAVDGYVWETLARRHPELSSRTRIVERSPQFGHPPFVARVNLSQHEFGAMQDVLLGMVRDAEGQSLLRELNLEGFVRGEPRLFDGIAAMMRAVTAG